MVLRRINTFGNYSSADGSHSDSRHGKGKGNELCNGIEGRTEIAVAIAGQSHSRKNFRKLNYKMNEMNRKGLHRIKELSYSSLRLTEIDSQRIIE